MITSALPTPAAPAPAAKASGGSGAAASSGPGESEFKQLMDGPADAPPRSDKAQADRAAPSDEPVAEASAEAGGDDAPADESETALPEQLLALIGWPPSANPASTTGTAPPATGPTGSAATADPTTALPQSLTAIALDGAAANATATSTSQPATAGIPGTATPTAGDPALPGLDPTAAAATPIDADVPPADFAKMFALTADIDPAGETASRTETGDSGLLLSATPAPATSARNPAATITATPLTMPADPDAGFDDAFGARISWMAEQGIGRAELRLNPEHLGVIDIRLQIDGNRISAEFQSANADVRHALENSVGRLRDMLGQHGMQLAHSDVGQGRGERQAGAGGDVRRDEPAGPGLEPANIRPVRVRGLLDEYA